MPFELQDGADEVSLILTGRLGVQQVRPLWDGLQPAIAAGRRIHLEASALEDIDTSIVQILCRLGRQPGQLRVGQTSDGFMASLKGRGLEKFFVQPGSPLATPEPVGKPKRTVARTGKSATVKVRAHG
jgi:ABC-type transporter Mla MlaB component